METLLSYLHSEFPHIHCSNESDVIQNQYFLMKRKMKKQLLIIEKLINNPIGIILFENTLETNHYFKIVELNNYQFIMYYGDSFICFNELNKHMINQFIHKTINHDCSICYETFEKDKMNWCNQCSIPICNDCLSKFKEHNPYKCCPICRDQTVIDRKSKQ